MQDSAIVGIDLGGTHLRLRFCDGQGGLLYEHRQRLEDRDSDAVIRLIAQRIEASYGQLGLEGPLRLSFAAAAMLDATGTTVRKAPNLKWRDVPLVAALQEALPIAHSTRLYNDVDAAAYGEWSLGAGQGADDMACVFVGSGVGCGLIAHRKLYSGSHRLAGEIGHVKVVTQSGRLCGCGAHGCMEAYAGGHALAAIAREAQARSPFLTARDGALSAADIVAGAEAEDPVCLGLFEQATTYLALALANLLTVLDPSHLILGGSVMLKAPSFYRRTLEEIQRFVDPIAFSQIHIAQAQLGDDAGVLGAVALAQQDAQSPRV